jgi:hypothetical protein
MPLWMLLFFAVSAAVVLHEGTLFARFRGETVGPDGVVVPRVRQNEKPGIARFLRDLLGCPLCSGCWIGWIAAAGNYRAELGSGAWEAFVPVVLGVGLATGMLSYFVKLTFDVLDALDTRP